MPDVELLTHSPPVNIRSSIEPCRDLLQPSVRIVHASAKLNDHVKPVFISTSTAVASSRFYGFQDESVKELIESVLPVSGDDEMPSPFGELAIMLFLAESLLHLFIFQTGSTASRTRAPCRMHAAN